MYGKTITHSIAMIIVVFLPLNKEAPAYLQICLLYKSTPIMFSAILYDLSLLFLHVCWTAGHI